MPHNKSQFQRNFHPHLCTKSHFVHYQLKYNFVSYGRNTLHPIRVEKLPIANETFTVHSKHTTDFQKVDAWEYFGQLTCGKQASVIDCIAFNDFTKTGIFWMCFQCYRNSTQYVRYYDKVKRQKTNTCLFTFLTQNLLTYSKTKCCQQLQNLV